MAIITKISEYCPSNDYNTPGTYIDLGERIEFVGRVIRAYCREVQVMSDVYCTGTFVEVLNEKDELQQVCIHSGFDGDRREKTYVVDATPETLAIVAILEEGKKMRAEAQVEKERQARMEEARNRPEKGKLMEVFKGRKVPKGFRGVVAFIGEGRVLLKDPTVWQDRGAQGVWVITDNLRAV